MDHALNYAHYKPSIGEVVKQYGRQLRSFISKKIKVTEDAEDILQDVWHQLTNLTAFDQLENAGAWLYAVARNKITDFYRKGKTDRIEDYIMTDDEGFDSFSHNLLLSDFIDPETVFLGEAFRAEFEMALNDLPEKQREVFVKNEIEGFTLQQIADDCGESLKTIISRKGYAVKHLRERLLPLYLEM